MEASTKYPILLVHGMGYRDHKHLGYWGRIPKVLEDHGAKVYFSGQDSNGSLESNACQVRDKLENVLKETGAEKVNIIAHSKGGLEARYLISTMGYADKVSTLTTLSTPHNGSLTVDKLLEFPKTPVKLGCKVCDLWFRILGDKNPDTYSVINLFRTDSAQKFNSENPDADGVYYQSFGFVMKQANNDIFMSIPWLVVNHFEGENDGLLTPTNVKWTNFTGVYTGNGMRGISHCDEVDMRRSAFEIKSDNTAYDDITAFYLDIVKNLKNKGF